MKRNKDVAKAIFREESSGHNNKAASDVLDDGILTQDDPGVNMHSDRDPDAVKVNQILQKQNAELRETVGYLKELVKLQGKVTDGTVYFDIAEIALSALGRQYIANNRISDLPSLRSLLEPWAVARNFAQKGVAWHFTIDDARTKLKHLYVFPDIFL